MNPVLRAYAEEAERRLAPGWHDYLETGSGEEISMLEAVRAWRDHRLRPRVLRPVAEVSTAVDLMGTSLRTPVLVAPTAWHRSAHPQAEVATAAGARAAGSLLVLSTRSSTPLEDVAAAAGPWWLQVYVTRERAITRDLVRRAVDLGAGALVLTGDTPIVPLRTRRRDTPPDDTPVMTAAFMPARAEPLGLQQDPGIGMDEIAWLADLSGLPVLVKGVLRGDDATACLDAGAAGIVVSNHGGRQLDRAVATAHALPEVVDAVGGRAPVLVDGGVRSGIDVLVALALGASAVMLGRPVVWGLAADGSDGVRTVLESVTGELLESLTLLGARSPGDVRRDDVVRPR